MMTNNKQQTAVEWQYIELSKFLNGKSEFTHKSDILIKAKEMEKERMIQFAKKCLDKALDLDLRTTYSQVEQHYNETYGGGEQ